MADIVTTKNELKIVAEFKDGDTRTLTVNNPNTAINIAACINSLPSAEDVLIGDKEGAEFLRFKEAKKVTGTTTYLDLNE